MICFEDLRDFVLHWVFKTFQFSMSIANNLNKNKVSYTVVTFALTKLIIITGNDKVKTLINQNSGESKSSYARAQL